MPSRAELHTIKSTDFNRLRRVELCLGLRQKWLLGSKQNNRHTPTVTEQKRGVLWLSWLYWLTHSFIWGTELIYFFLKSRFLPLKGHGWCKKRSHGKLGKVLLPLWLQDLHKRQTCKFCFGLPPPHTCFLWASCTHIYSFPLLKTSERIKNNCNTLLRQVRAAGGGKEPRRHLPQRSLHFPKNHVANLHNRTLRT